MVIKKLILDNFQGIKHFEFIPDGEDAAVYADNGCGKTTLYNAFCWLLYGKPSTNEVKFTPQTYGTHHLNHSAEMEIETEDGQRKFIKKVFHEKYQTQRGSAESVFTGYTTEYFLDGVPVREKDYQTAMEAIYRDDETAKLLTRFNYFLEDMKIKDRRSLLLDVCGNISDADVIAVNKELSELPGILDGRKIEDFLKIKTAERKKINEELKEIPARIDEAEKGKPEGVTVSNMDDAKKVLSDLKANKAELESSMAANAGDAEIRKEIAEAEAEKARAEKEFNLTETEKHSGILEKIRNKEVARNHAEIEKENFSADLSRKKASHDIHISDRRRLLDDYEVTKKIEWNGDLNCPTCGQPLPGDQIEEAKRRFNVTKSENLERIKAAIDKVSEAVLDDEVREIETLEKNYKEISDRMDALNIELLGLKEDIKPLQKYEDTEAGMAHIEKIKALKAKLEDADSAERAVKEKYQAKIDGIAAEIEKVENIILNNNLIQKQDERIRELESREKELSAQYEKIDRAIYLCELFNRQKAEMLTGKINDCFTSLKFRLFTEQINGSIADDCEAILDCNGVDVPFKSANNAARINAGLEVINVLGKYYGFTLPIFIDNAESSNHIKETEAQQIRLYVSSDKELTIKED